MTENKLWAPSLNEKWQVAGYTEYDAIKPHIHVSVYIYEVAWEVNLGRGNSGILKC